MKMGRPLVALAPPMSISSTHTKGKRRSTNKTNIAKIQRSDCPSFLERGMAERKAQSVRRMKGGKSWRGRAVVNYSLKPLSAQAQKTKAVDRDHHDVMRLLWESRGSKRIKRCSQSRRPSLGLPPQPDVHTSIVGSSGRAQGRCGRAGRHARRWLCLR